MLNLKISVFVISLLVAAAVSSLGTTIVINMKEQTIDCLGGLKKGKQLDTGSNKGF